MQYLVAGRIYSDYNAARSYADLLHRSAGYIVAVEAVTDDFQTQMRSLLHTSDDPPVSPF